MQSIWTANSDRDYYGPSDADLDLAVELNGIPAELDGFDPAELEPDPAEDAVDDALELALEQEESACFMPARAARRARHDAASLRRMARNACRSGRYLSTVDALAHRL